MTHLPFSAPHNWCDRRCERCPLAAACPIPKRDVQHRTTRDEDGDDLDSVDAAFEDGCRDIEAAIVALTPSDGEEAAASPREAAEAGQLRDAANALMVTFARASKKDPMAFAAAVLAATKVMRVATYLALGAADEDVWRVDAVPNLLLLERTKVDLRVSLQGRRDRTARDAAAALDVFDEVLVPLLERIDPSTRDALRMLVDGGRAPSPFGAYTPPNDSAVREALPSGRSAPKPNAARIATRRPAGSLH